ncbi:hypothetical protein [Paenibacillus xylanexedens]|uniref:hypothetical protein n=1 Tax=Paenibacillus xylanexedens TaxID=528191 RepID=UPI0016426E7C|nr:hypothetical protein [Paenibacillus xylanexedens]
MFIFLNFDSPSESKSYDKGLLFENLVCKIVGHVGYKHITCRQKRDNLEYDIVAVNKLTGKNLVGEAKAYEKKISDQIMTFYGKMAIFWADDPNTLGLFISVSHLTPDVKGQIDKLCDINSNFRYIVADEIIDLLSKNANYLTFEQVKAISETRTSFRPGETYLLISDRGDYYIQLLIPKETTLPVLYCVYDCYGNLIKDNKFLNLIKNKIDVLRELKVYDDGEYSYKLHTNANDKENFLGVLSGSGWFDYLFPAPPDKFIGREKIISKFTFLFDSVRNDETSTRVCQILSRSGVGKSSITLKLENEAINRGDIALGIDSRNIRTETDLLNIFQLLTKEINRFFDTKINLPSNQSEISGAVQESELLLKERNKIAIIFLDQFESVFSRPKLYNQIIDYILEFCSFNYRLMFCIARKNDQPTTYDESSEIDLNRLNGISQTYLLDDFKLLEAEFLIDKMKTELGRPLIQPLKEQVLEISNGFPWLLKKFCAHIIKLVKNGKTQTNIMQTGMQLENLFNEDLEALDEIVREFFHRLIHYLPATHTDLTEVFKDEDLSYKLKTLQNNHRLIRLTGRTYDTYNDVLKEYMKTGKIYLSKRYIFRLYPVPVIVLFEKIIKNNWNSVVDILNNTKQAAGAINNKLKVLRQVELIEGTNENFKPTEPARKAYHESKLKEYLSSILKQNTLVREVNSKVQKEKKVILDDLIYFLEKEMPFIDANNATWSTYGRYFSSWIDYVGIIDYKSGQLVPVGEGVSTSKMLLPSIYMPQLERFIYTLANSTTPKNVIQLAQDMGRKSINGAIADSLYLDLIEPQLGRNYTLNQAGENFAVMDKYQRREFISNKLKSITIIKTYYTDINDGMDSDIAFQRLCETAGFQGWSIETTKWKHKLLRNWLFYCGLIVKKRSKKSVIDQGQIEFIFDY